MYWMERGKYSCLLTFSNHDCPIEIKAESWLLWMVPLSKKQNLVEIVKLLSFDFFIYLFILPYPRHVEVLGPGFKLTPQQRPKPLQWQCWILNSLHHKGTPKIYYFILEKFIIHIVDLKQFVNDNWFWPRRVI